MSAPASSAVRPSRTRARAAEQLGDPAPESAADGATLVAAERDHQPDRRDHEAGAERIHVEQRAPEEHQAADDDERERRGVRGRPDHVPEARLDLLAGDASLPAEIEQRREEEPDRDEPEPDQLRMLVRSTGSRLLLRRPFLHARGRARPQRPLLLPGCHGGAFDAPEASPSSSPGPTTRAATRRRARAGSPRGCRPAPRRRRRRVQVRRRRRSRRGTTQAAGA